MSDVYTGDDGGLVFWHPVDDAPIDESFLPAGPVPAGSSADWRLRVRNTSGDYTAAAVVVSVGGPADPAVGDASGEYLLSLDGSTFAATAGLDDLAPQQVSDAFVLRRVTAGDAPAGAGGFTLTAAAAGWAAATTNPDVAGTAPAGGDVFDPDAADGPVEDEQGQM